jgi:hypothetical protein
MISIIENSDFHHYHPVLFHFMIVTYCENIHNIFILTVADF